MRTHRTVSTPFVYCPRARPARGIPPRLEPAKISPGLRSTSEWRTHENKIAARVPGSSSPRDITCKVIKRSLSLSLSLSLSVCLLPKNADTHSNHRFIRPRRTCCACVARSRTISRLRGPRSPWQRSSLTCPRERVLHLAAHARRSRCCDKPASM